MLFSVLVLVCFCFSNIFVQEPLYFWGSREELNKICKQKFEVNWFFFGMTISNENITLGELVVSNYCIQHT